MKPRMMFLKWPCAHCDKRMSYHRNYFMIRDHLWLKACRALRIDRFELLCLPCTEKGLGRPVRQRDLTDCLVNSGYFGFDKTRLAA